MITAWILLVGGLLALVVGGVIAEGGEFWGFYLGLVGAAVGTMGYFLWLRNLKPR